MNAHESRTEFRRSALTRRLADRRQIPYPFGSPEWLENIKNAYLAWPKVDRRDENRRAEERRLTDRRLASASARSRSAQNNPGMLLTEDERKLIGNLYSNQAD